MFQLDKNNKILKYKGVLRKITKMINFDRYGFLYFDLKELEEKNNIHKNKMSGLACLGEETSEPFSFNKIKDLPKNIIWYSNLTKEQVWRTGEGNIKDKNYLGISFDVLFSNIFKSMDKRKITKNISQLFQLVMFQTERIFIEQNKVFDLENIDLVMLVYKNFMTKTFQPNTTEIMRGILKEAYLETITSPDFKVKNGNRFYFYLDPNFFLEEILKENIPMGEWREVLKREEGDLKNYLIKNINDTRSFLVKIDNLKLKTTFSTSNKKMNEAALWLGSRGFLLNGSIIDEIWLTEKEFQYLKDRADFDIIKIYQNNQLKNLKSLFYQQYNDLISSDLKNISITGQIIKTIFLQAFISKGFIQGKENLYTENMIWYRVKEREILFERVKELQGQVEIKEFGNGCVVIDVKKIEDQKKLVKTLINNNFIVPYFLCAQEIDEEDIFLSKSNENDLKQNIYPYNVVDYKFKNKFIKSNNDENSAYLLVDNILLSKNKKEQINVLKSMNFTSQDENDSELKWGLEEFSKVIKERGR